VADTEQTTFKFVWFFCGPTELNLQFFKTFPQTDLYWKSDGISSNNNFWDSSVCVCV